MNMKSEDLQDEKMADPKGKQNDNDDDDDGDGALCPLFMEGLPRNFADNPQLAAIASLLEESDDEKHKPAAIQHDKPKPVSGGGKARNRKSRSSRSHKPYSNPKKAEGKEKPASLGEAQLFLTMWKL